MNIRDLPRFDPESRKDCREMIRYFCNLCQQEIDPGHDGSYLVRMEVYAAQSANHMPIDDDRDHLEEFNEVLERYEEFEEDGPFLGNTNHRKARRDRIGQGRAQSPGAAPGARGLQALQRDAGDRENRPLIP